MEFPNEVGISSSCDAQSQRSTQDLSTICWTYPLCGIPTEASVESQSLGVMQCEAGCQREKIVDVQLVGCALEKQQVTNEYFACKVHSDCKAIQVEESICATVKTARKDLISGAIKLTLHILFSPLKQSLSQYKASVIVECVSGGSWRFPITLNATKPQLDDVIHIKAPEVGKTSSVGFRLTSTFRNPEPYTAVFLPGSSNEFKVASRSGMLPPINSTGTLITVSFTPRSNSRRSRARLQIKAAAKLWTYEVKGSILHNSPNDGS
ncbi:unnamed protein product [Knipowitschia caucasica]